MSNIGSVQTWLNNVIDSNRQRDYCALIWMYIFNYKPLPYTTQILRATSHTRLIACYHYTSSTLIGVKGGAGPSSVHMHHG